MPAPTRWAVSASSSARRSARRSRSSTLSTARTSSPAIGAQGGTADDVRRIFGDALRNVVPSVSREVLRHGPDIAALRDAVVSQITQFGFLRN